MTKTCNLLHEALMVGILMIFFPFLIRPKSIESDLSVDFRVIVLQVILLVLGADLPSPVRQKNAQTIVKCKILQLVVH